MAHIPGRFSSYKTLGAAVAAALLTVMGVALFSSAPARAATVLDRVVAKVNKEAITWIELYQGMESEFGAQLSQIPEHERARAMRAAERQFLDRMIDQKLQVQEAKRLDIKVEDQDIDRAVDDIRQRYKMNPEEFERAIGKEGISMERYREMLMEQILVGRVVEREVREKVRLEIEAAKAETAKAADTQKQRADDPNAAYNISLIFMRSAAGADPDPALAQKVKSVSDALAAGEDFAKIAEKYSDDPSGAKGGNLGVIKKSDMSADFKEIIKDLKPGEASKPFRGAKGVYILKINDMKSGADMDPEELFQRRLDEWLKSLRDNSFVEIML